MVGGAGSYRPFGRVHKPNKADAGWNAAPSYPKVKPHGNRVGSGDAIARSTNKTWASVRVANAATGPSESSGGPINPRRGARRYEGPGGQASS
jgi:hypothetical protein